MQKELRTTSVFQIVQSIYEAGVLETIAVCRKFGKKIGFLNFVELLISDGLVIMLPIAYVVVRILTGHMLLIGDFIGIAQSITTFGWDLEWFFDELIAIKGSVALYPGISGILRNLSENGNRRQASGLLQWI